MSIIEITGKFGDRIEFRVGPKVEGYSCENKSGITSGRISVGHSNMHGLTHIKVWVYKYDPFPWEVIVTDQEMIERLEKQDKGYWLSSLVKLTLLKAAECDCLLYLIQTTLEMTEKNAFKAGETSKAREIIRSLGINA